MKTIVTTLVTIFVSFTSYSSYANDMDHAAGKSPSSLMITRYLSVISQGDFEGNKLSFTRDFEYHNVMNDRKYNRRQYTAFLKKVQGLRYDCKTSYEILDETSHTCIAKVVMEFANFTRIDYITLYCQEEDWQISKVVTTYP